MRNHLLFSTLKSCSSSQVVAVFIAMIGYFSLSGFFFSVCKSLEQFSQISRERTCFMLVSCLGMNLVVSVTILEISIPGIVT